MEKWRDAWDARERAGIEGGVCGCMCACVHVCFNNINSVLH